MINMSIIMINYKLCVYQGKPLCYFALLTNLCLNLLSFSSSLPVIPFQTAGITTPLSWILVTSLSSCSFGP